MAERMFAAIERGSKVNVDLSDKWGDIGDRRADDATRLTRAAALRGR
jgi:hypothetical protein